ncbi:MAG: hypothetical protein RR538_03905 [Erysipelotrichaceae bacterium]|uniref:hypothetical protein n=1 Tax=Anaerorhabdus sp. TaxID=1872524 RepID=UPI002FCB1DFC
MKKEEIKNYLKEKLLNYVDRALDDKKADGMHFGIIAIFCQILTNEQYIDYSKYYDYSKLTKEIIDKIINEVETNYVYEINLPDIVHAYVKELEFGELFSINRYIKMRIENALDRYEESGDL